jgi:N-acetylmuramoyl-L-alanine amidase
MHIFSSSLLGAPIDRSSNSDSQSSSNPQRVGTHFPNKPNVVRLRKHGVKRHPNTHDVNAFTLMTKSAKAFMVATGIGLSGSQMFAMGQEAVKQAEHVAKNPHGIPQLLAEAGAKGKEGEQAQTLAKAMVRNALHGVADGTTAPSIEELKKLKLLPRHEAFKGLSDAQLYAVKGLMEQPEVKQGTQAFAAPPRPLTLFEDPHFFELKQEIQARKELKRPPEELSSKGTKQPENANGFPAITSAIQLPKPKTSFELPWQKPTVAINSENARGVLTEVPKPKDLGSNNYPEDCRPYVRYSQYTDGQLNTPPAQNPEAPVIVLDAGHGGSDPGKVVNNINEKDLNLQNTFLLREALIAKGFQPKMTRTDDVRLPLGCIEEIAEGYKPKAFISIHQNANVKPDVQGHEVFYTYAPGQELSQAISDSLGSHLSYSTNRGATKENFRVIKYGSNPEAVPHVLAELGFMTNPTELAALQNPWRQKQSTQGIVEGLSQYLEAHPE